MGQSAQMARPTLLALSTLVQFAAGQESSAVFWPAEFASNMSLLTPVPLGVDIPVTIHEGEWWRGAVELGNLRVASLLVTVEVSPQLSPQRSPPASHAHTVASGLTVVAHIAP